MNKITRRTVTESMDDIRRRCQVAGKKETGDKRTAIRTPYLWIRNVCKAVKLYELTGKYKAIQSPLRVFLPLCTALCLISSHALDGVSPFNVLSGDLFSLLALVSTTIPKTPKYDHDDTCFEFCSVKKRQMATFWRSHVPMTMPAMAP